MEQVGSRIETRPTGRSYPGARRPVRWTLITVIALLHVAALYGLARLLAPDFTQTVERDVVSAITVTITAPPEPEAPSEPDQGAEGAPAPKAVAEPVSRPTSPLPVKPAPPRPPVASTGAASQSGAAAEGAGTGPAGSGQGTGSGNAGSGSGAGAATKPVHISGSIDNARDFPVPPGGRAARRGHEVIVRVIVGTDGRARDCSIYRPSPDPEADRITCELVETRLGFRPAMNAAGEPVAALFYWRQRWF